MRLPIFVVLGWCVMAALAQGESMDAWLSHAPKADIVFIPWESDLPSAQDNGRASKHLAQHFYGYLDCSRIPASAFPVRLRLLYDSVPFNASIIHSPGGPNQLTDNAPVGAESVKEERILDDPQHASAIPVWTAFYAIGAPFDYNTQESVRAEILDRNGAVAARYAIGVSRLGNDDDDRVLIVNTPGGDEPFIKNGYQTIANVQRLVPDSSAFTGVEVIWIDSATANDPAYTDAFWQQVLLGGTTVAGMPGDIATLSTRLALQPGQPVLLGGLRAANSPAEFNANNGDHRPVYAYADLNGAANPFSFSVALGLAMHQQLLRFSMIYLGVFVALQALVIALAFMGLRGVHRVWLWLIVPGVALIYAVGGIAFARLAVRAQSDSHLTQLEFQREGWPGAVLLSHLEQINLTKRETHLEFPPSSRPYLAGRVSWKFDLTPGFLFSESPGATTLSFYPSPGFRAGINVRSLLDYHPAPVEMADGALRTLDTFSGAWLWDGSEWRNLGPLYKGAMPFDWKLKPAISPADWPTGAYPNPGILDNGFPSALGPLLNRQRLAAIGAAGDGLFLGVEAVSDVKLENGPDDSVATRHVVAYQFHLKGGPP